MQRKLWLFYTLTVLRSFIAFAVATFCFGVYFTHLHGSPLWMTIGIALIYIFVIYACVAHVAKTLPFAVTMLLIPIAPLFVLLLVISFLPLWQKLM